MRKTSLNSVYELAKTDPSIVFIGSDLGPGVLDNMKNEMPERFFMEGVAEQHIVGMAAGMAMEGMKPFVNTIATFLTRRCFEQVAIDLCLHDLPVKLIANGGGVVYAPLGPTHLATDDIGILRTLPNMTIVAPCDADEMRRLMPATLDWQHPIYIRLAKGGDNIVSNNSHGFEIGKAILLREPKDGLFVSTGVMTQKCLSAAELLVKDGLEAGVLHMHTIKPLDSKSINELIPSVKKLVTVEEHSKIGGLGSAILEEVSDSCPEQLHKIRRVGIDDYFANQYGSQETLLDAFGISIERIARVMRE